MGRRVAGLALASLNGAIAVLTAIDGAWVLCGLTVVIAAGLLLIEWQER